MLRSTAAVGRGVQLGLMLGILAFAGLDGVVGLCGGDLGFLCFIAKGGGLALGGAILGGIVGAVVASRSD